MAEKNGFANHLAWAAAVWCVALIARAQDVGTSQWVHPGESGKLVYKTTPAGDRIMDFSYAGYMGGGVALPVVPVRLTVQPSSGADDSAAIQQAIDDVSKLPAVDGFRGAVMLAPGNSNCSRTITIAASGVVLRGSGAAGANASTIKLTGSPHLAIAIRLPSARGGRANADASSPRQQLTRAQTSIADAYLPSGTMSFDVTNASGLAVGDWIAIRKPVTKAWVKFMGMNDLVRDTKPETWLKVGSVLTAERKIAAITGNKITVDVPLSDSYDARYLNPPGTAVVKIEPPATISQSGIEDLHIESPPQAINHTQPHFQALRINGRDCWARDVICDETMNSIAVGGSRITLLRVAVNRKTAHVGSSKPAEFAPDGTQVLLDRCSASGDNIWFSATGGGHSGPIVLLNCTFRGNGRAESHQRWSTGLLYDNCHVPEGGIDVHNRGEMGSGHGWTMGFGVVWNCQAKSYIVQNPPGAINWMIGCVGENKTAARPFGKEPMLPSGTIESPGKPVTPQSLYLTQLVERLGPAAVKNIGY